MLPWLSNVSLHWRIGQAGGKPSSKMESLAHWQQGSVLNNATFTILSLAILWKGRVAESKSRKHAQAFRFLKSQPRLGEVGSVVSCMECTSVLEDELAYLGTRNYQRQAHRISRLLRFLGKTPSYLILAKPLPSLLRISSMTCLTCLYSRSESKQVIRGSGRRAGPHLGGLGRECRGEQGDWGSMFYQNNIQYRSYLIW